MNQPLAPEKTSVIIIGGGVAGAAAALRAAQNHLPALWVLGDSRTHKASRAAYVRNIDNMVGVHPDIVRNKILQVIEKDHPQAAAAVRGAHLHISTADLVGNARQRIESEFADVVTEVPAKATGIKKEEAHFVVEVDGGRRLAAPAVVVATGVSDRQPVIHRRKGDRVLAGIHWLFPYANHETLLYCIRCEGHMTRGRRVGVIGAGPAAAEIALMLRERYDAQVTILTAGEDPLWSARRQELLDRLQVSIVHGPLTDIHGGDKGASLHGFSVEGAGRIDVDLAFVAMGLYRIAHELLQDLGVSLEDSPLPLEQRHVVVDDRGETSCAGLFAIGDMATHRERGIMKQVYTSQEYAVRAVDTIDGRRRRDERRALFAEGTATG